MAEWRDHQSKCSTFPSHGLEGEVAIVLAPVTFHDVLWAAINSWKVSDEELSCGGIPG